LYFPFDFFWFPPLPELPASLPRYGVCSRYGLVRPLFLFQVNCVLELSWPFFFNIPGHRSHCPFFSRIEVSWFSFFFLRTPVLCLLFTDLCENECFFPFCPLEVVFCFLVLIFPRWGNLPAFAHPPLFFFGHFPFPFPPLKSELRPSPNVSYERVSDPLFFFPSKDSPSGGLGNATPPSFLFNTLIF